LAKFADGSWTRRADGQSDPFNWLTFGSVTSNPQATQSTIQSFGIRGVIVASTDAAERTLIHSIVSDDWAFARFARCRAAAQSPPTPINSAKKEITNPSHP
jgi:hypothetical protein